MNILIIAQYNLFPWEGGNGRFSYLLDKLDCDANNIEFITSNFRHETKSKRTVEERKNIKLKYKLTMLDEPGYRKNVSLKRLYSHKILALNLKKYLEHLNYCPNVIYCAVPSLDIAHVAVRYANSHNVKFVLDIQDLWPEAFRMALNVPIVSDMLFYPMLKKANYIYSRADKIVAVSQTYVNRALEVNKKTKSGTCLYLGTDLNYFDSCAKSNLVKFNDDIVRVAYVGTLGTSYNIKIVIDAIKILNDRGINNVKFIIMGDGPLKAKFEVYAKNVGIDCEFTGKLIYSDMVGLLVSCDIGVNPIVDSSVASIINKVCDYAAAGIPVINTQNSKEYRSLVNEYEIGFNCKNDDVFDVAEKIKLLVDNKDIRVKYGKNNRKLAEKKFDRNVTYGEVIHLLEE